MPRNTTATPSRRSRRVAPATATIFGVAACLGLGASSAGADPGGADLADTKDHQALHAAVERQAREEARRLGDQPVRRFKDRDRVRPLRRSARARAAVAGDPAQVGRWAAPFGLPNPAVHSVVLATGKVLFFSEREIVNNTAQAWLYDPRTGALKRVDPPADERGRPVNIFCGGQSVLADGRVLVTGGTLDYPSSARGADDAGGNVKGLNQVFTFNPYNETWTRQPDMRHGRWYPTQTLQPNGETLIIGGDDETGTGTTNAEMEVFTPSPDLNGRGTVRLVTPENGALPDPVWYPHMFVMPSGRTLFAGPYGHVSWFVNGAGPSSFSWTDIPNTGGRNYGSAVLIPSGPNGSTQVMQIGGVRPNAKSTPIPSTEVFDESTNAWRPTGSMNVGRAHHNTVLLPDGGMVSIGGGVGRKDSTQFVALPEQRQIELFDPATGTWRLGPEQAEARAYHSTAVLLPDARVLSAGDNGNGGKLVDTGEIYEPPYLFRGPRPTIESAPGAVRYGARFTVGSRDQDVARAVLVAPSAVTHATDMNQRHLSLPLTRRGDGRGVDVVAPSGPTAAPPGPYMLFLLNDRGVPSVASWVRLDAAAAPTAPLGNQVAAARPAPRSPAGRRALRPRRVAMRTATRRGVLVRARCTRACRVTATLVLDRRTARRLRVRAVIGRATTTLRRRGTAVFRVRVNRRAALRLRRSRAVSVTLRTRVEPRRGGRTQTRSRALRIVR